MIRQPSRIRHYNTAQDRYLKPAIANFFKQEFSGAFGPMVIDNIAEQLVNIFNETCPEATRVKHGQMVWNALDKSTRADSPKRRYKTVILDLVTPEDVELYKKDIRVKEIRKKVIARLIKQTYQQEGILSMRDLSLILVHGDTMISTHRAEYEKEHNLVLPHTGVIHDMGSTITHKAMIVHKHIIEKKSPDVVARETNHSQRAVDHYLNDYYRVKMLYLENKNIDYINLATKIAKPVINQYLNIINQYVKEQV
ncbi:MAG: DUF1670 domain-containing protein [Bacteroidota bacterium]